MQNNNATTVKGNYNSNQNQMNRQQGIKGQNNINQNIQANNIPQGNNMQNNIDFTRVPVVTTVNNLIVTAVNLGASDMHFDPTEDGIIVRFRIDGLLRNYVSLPQEIKQNVITRIKIMAGMNITETRLPQDGAIKDKLNGKDLDLRVSALPTKRGEKIVIRIMDYSMSLKGIEYLYFNETNYNKILKMRNDYIKLIFEGKTSDYNYFNILTDYLIEKSIQIYQYRNNFINQLNNISSNIFKNISSIDGFNIKYKNSIKFDNYDSEEIRKKLKNYYNKNFEREIKFKTTLIGPHRDDFEFYIENFNLKNYGSQGQQRMSILAIKLAEIEIFYETKKEYPILLLDDVFSELDDQKKNNLLNYIKDNMQTIITTTDLKNIDESIINKSKLIEIKNGKITKEVN